MVFSLTYENISFLFLVIFCSSDFAVTRLDNDSMLMLSFLLFSKTLTLIKLSINNASFKYSFNSAFIIYERLFLFPDFLLSEFNLLALMDFFINSSSK
ncbi:Uncharacterised protein [Chlamydia abortus]|nr:Uncharacterised protein [Chlamydia abortus]SGA31670.1 Uncharacterised protein [Chlamydia abortus]SGA32386.1 Uncharacterised protein [Chlamydia abortus]